MQKIMTTLQMRAKKAELISTIINDVNSQDKLETVSLFLKEIMLGEKQVPCRYSVAELNERAQQAVSDYEKGRNLISHSQISRKKITG
jgi:hypothetical protein